MKYLSLKSALKQNLFTVLDVKKYFPNETDSSIRIQLSRFAQRGLISKVKRGLYCFDAESIEEFELANKLYQPSYVSLEAALNYYGIIPDIPQSVTSITTTTTKKIENQFGTFLYLKMKQELFWGYESVKTSNESAFLIADRQKALLDFFYIRKIRQIEELRLDTSSLESELYKKYASFFPKWVQQIKLRLGKYSQPHPERA